MNSDPAGAILENGLSTVVVVGLVVAIAAILFAVVAGVLVAQVRRRRGRDD